MKKFIIISLIASAYIISNNAFGILTPRLIPHAKNIKSFGTKAQISSNIADIKIRELISKQRQLQKENDAFRQRIAEQNELIDELNDEVDYLNGFLTHPSKTE